MRDAWKVMAGVVATVGLGIFLGSSVNVHGNIINADTGYQLGATAPVGHTLVGNGTYYVDSGPVTQLDEWNTFAGCAYANDGANLTCSSNVTVGTAFADTNYQVLCNWAWGSAPVNWMAFNYNISGQTTTGYTVNQITSGSSTIWSSGNANYGINWTCHAHHS